MPNPRVVVSFYTARTSPATTDTSLWSCPAKAAMSNFSRHANSCFFTRAHHVSAVRMKRSLCTRLEYGFDVELAMRKPLECAANALSVNLESHAIRVVRGCRSGRVHRNHDDTFVVSCAPGCRIACGHQRPPMNRTKLCPSGRAYLSMAQHSLSILAATVVLRTFLEPRSVACTSHLPA